MSFLVLDQEFVNAHLSPEACVPLMEDVLKKECEGSCIQYLRTAIPLPNTNVLGLMPGWFDTFFGVKVISVYHDNARKGYPSHQGQILLFKEEFGEVIASVDAMSVTKNRTGAVSAVASKALANPDSHVLAVLGCGAQGDSHIRAIMTQFALTDLYVWDMYEEAAKRMADRYKDVLHVHVCSDVKEAVKDADIICTVTPSKAPILSAKWVKPGAHINAVGACAPGARELDSAIVAKARFFCDNVESVLHESGDFLFPQREGLIGREHILGTVGQVLCGNISGRERREDITVFEALGMAVEDIAAAKYLYDVWRENNHELG